MSNIGNLLLKLRGVNDPTSNMISEIFGGGAGLPGATTAAGRAPAGYGVPTQGTGAPTQPQQSPLYSSPPDLMSLYSQLADYQSKQDSVNSGLGLLASALVHPENKQAALQAFGGGGPSTDPLSLVSKVAEFRADQAKQEADAAARARMMKSVPAIAEQYGMDESTAQFLADNGQLDDFIMEAAKAKAQGRKTDTFHDDKTGHTILYDVNTGETIKDLGGGLAAKKEIWVDPQTNISYVLDTNDPTAAKVAIGGGMKPDWQLVTDEGTGKMSFVNKNDPTQVRPVGGSLKPSDMQAEYDQMKADGILPDGINSVGAYRKWLAEAAKPTNTVNIDTKSDTTLADSLDTQIADAVKTIPASMQTINTIQNARAALDAPGGVIMGSILAPGTLSVRKAIGSIFGLPDAATSNTEQFQSAMKEIVLPRVKALGTGNSISNADREFVEKAVGGSIELNEESSRRILTILEKGEHNEIIKNRTKMQKRIDATTSPEGKSRMQASWDALDGGVPRWSDGYINDIVGPEAIQWVKTHNTPEELKRFDELYESPGLAEQLLNG